MHLGIDFGTCYSSAALFTDGTLRRVKEPLNHGYAFPSSVCLSKQGDILVGQAAEARRLLSPDRYRRELKRYLGSEVPLMLGDRPFQVEELVSEILRRIKAEAEKMTGETLDKAVVTIPATFSAYKQGFIEKAAQQAGFASVSLLEEPVAAALYYVHQGMSSQTLAEGDIILVYDLGGGTFDAALLQKKGESFELLAQPVGDEHCGGVDFDRQIYQDLSAECAQTLGLLLDPSRKDAEAVRARLTLNDWCRDFKHQLSEETEYENLVPVGGGDLYVLNRQKFEGMIAPFISKTVELCQQLVNDAQLNWTQVNRVLMVGGSCRVPYVKQTLEREFGCTIVNVDEPELSVCLGAALNTNVVSKQDISEDEGFLQQILTSLQPDDDNSHADSNIDLKTGGFSPSNKFTPFSGEDTFYTSGPFMATCLDEKGTLLAVQGINLIYIIRISTQKIVKKINVVAAYNYIYFSSNNKYIIGLGFDNLDIYDLEKAQIKTRVTISLFNGKFNCLSLHDDEVAFLRQGNAGAQYFYKLNISKAPETVLIPNFDIAFLSSILNFNEENSLQEPQIDLINNMIFGLKKGDNKIMEYWDLSGRRLMNEIQVPQIKIINKESVNPFHLPDKKAFYHLENTTVIARGQSLEKKRVNSHFALLKVETGEIIGEYSFEHPTIKTSALMPTDSQCNFFSTNRNSEYFALESYHEKLFGIRRDDTEMNVNLSYQKCMIYDISGQSQLQEIDVEENFYSASPCISSDGKTIAFLTESFAIVTFKVE